MAHILQNARQFRAVSARGKLRLKRRRTSPMRSANAWQSGRNLACHRSLPRVKSKYSSDAHAAATSTARSCSRVRTLGLVGRASTWQSYCIDEARHFLNPLGSRSPSGRAWYVAGVDRKGRLDRCGIFGGSFGNRVLQQGHRRQRCCGRPIFPFILATDILQRAEPNVYRPFGNDAKLTLSGGSRRANSNAVRLLRLSHGVQETMPGQSAAEHPCPDCALPLIMMRTAFRAPRRTDEPSGVKSNSW